MNRLLLTFGLVIAFFITDVQASIYDFASNLTPKIDSHKVYNCSHTLGIDPDMDIDACAAKGKSIQSGRIASDNVLKNCTTKYYSDYDSYSHSCELWHTWVDSADSLMDNNFSVSSSSYVKTEQSLSCPPDGNQTYGHDYDSNNDGQIDKCYNPMELDQLSNCQSQLGNILPALNNSSLTVCKTDSSSGVSCGFSQSSSANTYSLNLEVNCFGDSDIPEYDTTPQPELPKEDDKCTQVSTNLMACLGDANTCDANGVCPDQCGYVNGTFMCFAECTGDQCAGDDLPSSNTDPDPNEPTPEFCAANPTDPSCVNVPPPCTGDNCDPDNGGGGGGGVATDITPIVDELKEINKKLDFDTISKSLTLDDLGGFGTIFGSDDIDSVKTQITDKKDEINDYISELKGEFSSMFELKASGGSYEPITLDLSMGSFDIGFWDFVTSNTGVIASIIMFLAFLMAVRIVFE